MHFSYREERGPQGSQMEPLLFILYVNVSTDNKDIANAFIYADDTVLIIIILIANICNISFDFLDIFLYIGDKDIKTKNDVRLTFIIKKLQVVNFYISKKDLNKYLNNYAIMPTGKKPYLSIKLWL